jgi:uncharacterized membrane protein
VITGQNAPAKIAVRPSMEKAADMQASASATMKVASLTDVAEERCIACGPETPVTSTGSVTAVTSGVKLIKNHRFEIIEAAG